MTELITFLLSNFSLTAFLLGLIVATARSLMLRVSDFPAVIDIFLREFVLWGIGVSLFYNFVIHVFFAEMAAKFIGWQNSPFQYEVGYASLGFSVVAMVAYRSALQVKFVAVLGPALFLWGAAIGHIDQLATSGNHSPGNAGVVLWTDILLPLVGFLLLFLASRTNDSASTRKSCKADSN